MRLLKQSTCSFAVTMLVCIYAFNPAMAEANQLLWQIGEFDNSDSEFALAHGDYTNFLE